MIGPSVYGPDLQTILIEHSVSPGMIPGRLIAPASRAIPQAGMPDQDSLPTMAWRRMRAGVRQNAVSRADR